MEDNVPNRRPGSQGETRLAVIIPTFGRKELLHQVVRHLELQSRLPDEIIVSTPVHDLGARIRSVELFAGLREDVREAV